MGPCQSIDDNLKYPKTLSLISFDYYYLKKKTPLVVYDRGEPAVSYR